LRDGKRKASEADTELHLLEANRKRLLTQKDWVGIDPSKPVSLRFRSSREKSKIGKRRRTTRGRGAAPRQKNKDEFGNEVHNFADDAFAQVLGDSGPRQRLDDVRIRIGTDAMTTYSTQLDQYAQSHASSESMLFDQEEPLAQLRSAKPPVDLELLAATSAFEQADVASRAPSTGEQPQHYGLARRSVASPSPDASEQKSFTGDQFELQCQPATMTSRENESSTHDFRLTHHAYGEERAFRLAFSGSNSTAGARGRTASDGNQIGETKPFDDPDSVGESKTGYVHQHNIDRERSVGVDVSAANTIVDEGPWKTYLAISDGSSHSDKSILSRSSVPHDYPAKRHNNEAAMDWSQHATQGQGNESRISSSSVSASLPSLKRGVRKPISAHASDMALIRRDRPVNAAVQSLDEDEKNWQAFVFQTDDNDQGMHDHACKISPLVPKYSENSSSRCLPLSRAVSSVSPATFESRPRIASGTGYDALESRALTPSTFLNDGPLALGGFVEGVSGNKQGEKMLGRTVFDGQSHASLQNHASSDIISSRVFSSTKTSRNLDGHASAVAQHPTWSNRRILRGNSQGSSSGCDILTSDDGALHLVDPNKR